MVVVASGMVVLVASGTVRSKGTGNRLDPVAQ
jgi:hypothetical protein